MRVFVTGAGGFIGRALARHLHEMGHTVSGSSHDPARLESLADFLERSVELTLDGPVAPETFAHCDAVVHCAHDSTVGAAQRNIDGTRRIFEAAERAGVPFQLLIGSHSARPDAVSEYGRLKYALEQFFMAHGQAIIRPGLVIGDGGLFARNRRAILRASFLPLPGADRTPVFYIALNDLMTCIERILDERLSGAFNLFVATPASLRDFVGAIARVHGRRSWILPLPATPLFLGLDLVKRLGIPLPGAIDRLETMRQNMGEAVHVSDLARFVAHPTPLTMAILNSAAPHDEHH